MGQNFSDVCRTLAEYHCPRYEELPHIALYKDQVVSVLNEAVGPFFPPRWRGKRCFPGGGNRLSPPQW